MEKNLSTPIYRYEGINPEIFDKNLKNYLLNQTIYLNHRKQFNDPFDMFPTYKDAITFQTMKQYFKEKKRTGFSTKFGLVYADLTKKDINKFSHNDLTKFRNISRKAINEFTDNSGVKCFSTELDNILLWSHYGSGHRGYCIKFIPNGASDLKYNFPVEYHKNRPILEITANLSYRNELFISEILPKIYLHKYETWQYEKEFRLPLPDMAGKEMKFDLSEIDSVYLGLKISDTHKNKILDLCSKINKPVYQMASEGNSYKLSHKLIT